MDKKIEEMDKKPIIIVNERPEFMEPTPILSPSKEQQTKPIKLKTE